MLNLHMESEGPGSLKDKITALEEERAVNKGYCFITFASAD